MTYDGLEPVTYEWITDHYGVPIRASAARFRIKDDMVLRWTMNDGVYLDLKCGVTAKVHGADINRCLFREILKALEWKWPQVEE